MAIGKFTGVGEVMERYSKMIMDALKANLEKNDSIASSSLWESIQMPVTIYARGYVAELKMEDYWKYVEYGREPGGKMPPLEPIIKWTSQKGLDIGRLSERRARKIRSLKTRRIKKTYKSISLLSLRKQLAFLIARKIAKKGIEPTHFFSEVVNDVLIAKIKADVTRAAGKEIPLQIIQRPF